MEYSCTQFLQNGQRYLSAVLPFHIIYDNSIVLVYGLHPGGYQREPEPRHIAGIKNYILENKNFKLPTSIILAIDEEDLSSVLVTNGNFSHLLFDAAGFSKPPFRIVDGQHRLMGIQAACKSMPSLVNLELHVLILVTSINERSIEMEVFTQINSKSKRIKVDLIELARFEYQLLEHSVEKSDLADHIAMRTSKILNESSKSNVWYNAIKFGIHDEEKVGIIGVHAFKDSILSVVETFMEINKRYIKMEREQLIRYSKEVSVVVAGLIEDIWKGTIFRKWPNCFYKDIMMDIFMEVKETHYRKDYYLQKTLGVKSIHNLLVSILRMELESWKHMKFNITDDEEANEKHSTILFTKVVSAQFATTIDHNLVQSNDWLIGGPLSGYSSESGFSKVAKMLAGTIPVPR